MVNSWLHVLHLMLNLREGDNELESVRDTVSLHYKVCFNSTTLKSPHLLMESGGDVLLVHWLEQLKQTAADIEGLRVQTCNFN